jgi:hypothetical protein
VGAVFVSAVLAAAGPSPATPPEKAASGAVPRVTVDKPEIDVGRVVRGTVLEAAFELRNDGGAELRILSAKPG